MSVETIAYCGRYCGTCGVGEGLVSERAKKLAEVIEAYRFEDLITDFFDKKDAQIVLDQAIMNLGYSEEDVAALREEIERSRFDFSQFKAGLEWFGKVGCVGCREGGGSPVCLIRMCARSKKIKGCWECEVMEECRTLLKLEEEMSYNFMDNLKNIKRIGEEAYAKKMEKKRVAGYDDVLDSNPSNDSKTSPKKKPKKK